MGGLVSGLRWARCNETRVRKEGRVVAVVESLTQRLCCAVLHVCEKAHSKNEGFI